MFVSSDFLGIQYGVQHDIANFFVDREPPKENLYWHGKLMYLRQEPGFLFIPLIVDLLCKIGLKKEDLLSELFVSTMEQIGHISALEELEKISKQEALEQYQLFIQPIAKNNFVLQQVANYLNGNKDNIIHQHITQYPALHRGDAFLFSLATLQFEEEKFETILKLWFALISVLLLQDDAEDYEKDAESADENAFLQAGITAEGITNIKKLLAIQLQLIATINKSMATTLDNNFKKLAIKPSIEKLLNL